MKNKIHRNLLIPLWELYDLDSLDEVIFTIDSSEYLKNVCALEERKNIYESLKWAKDNPDFYFEDIMKGTPVIGSLKY